MDIYKQALELKDETIAHRRWFHENAKGVCLRAANPEKLRDRCPDMWSRCHCHHRSRWKSAPS